MTTVATYRVLLRGGKDAAEYTLERTYRSLVPPSPRGGPYLNQEGDVFFVDEVLVARRAIRGWQPLVSAANWRSTGAGGILSA